MKHTPDEYRERLNGGKKTDNRWEQQLIAARKSQAEKRCLHTV